MRRAQRTLSWLVMASLALPALACGNERPTRATPDADRAAHLDRDAIRTVPTGTIFEIRTHTALSTERNRPGDALTASLAGPLIDADGTVIVPGDAILRARVTAVASPEQVDQPAVLHLAFEAIAFAGHSYPIQATIEQVIGRTGITTIPAATLDGVTGTGIALQRENWDAILPRGTDLSIRLTAPVSINRRSPGAR